MLHRSDTNAPANHGPRASSALDAGVDGNTDGRDNAHPAARRNTGTADRAMRGDRSPQTPRVEASRVVTGLVTVFLARPDFRWLALTNPRLHPCRKRPASGAIWLGMTYGSDGTRTRDLRRDRTALFRDVRRPGGGDARPRQRVPGGMAGGMTGRKCGPGLARADPPDTVSLADRRWLESADYAGSSTVTRVASITHGAAGAWWPIRSSKPVGPGSPRLGRFDSFAASWLDAGRHRWIEARQPDRYRVGAPHRAPSCT